MKIAVIAFTRAGAAFAGTLTEKLGADGFAPQKYRAGNFTGFNALCDIAAALWENYDALVFVGACGIAVRAVSPYIEDKSRDCAVVVMDERGKFCIPILSGHMGGANALAEKIAAFTGAQAVITTATDVNGAFAVDTFAAANKLHIEDTKLIKEISSRVLDGEKIGLASGCELLNVPACFTETARAGIYIGAENKKPFEITLNLVPRNIVVGIGCRRNAENVTETIEEFLRENNVSADALCAAATVDIKKDEKGILNFCEKYSLPLLTFTANELNEADGEFTASSFVKKTVGTDNVCERAVCAAGAEIIVKKTARNAVTMALGERAVKIDFNK